MSQESLLLHGPFARKPKRIRTAFSPSQLLRLERAFEKNHYVVGAERKQLASSLSLSETQVRPPLPPSVRPSVQLSISDGTNPAALCINPSCVWWGILRGNWGRTVQIGDILVYGVFIFPQRLVITITQLEVCVVPLSGAVFPCCFLLVWGVFPESFKNAVKKGAAT